MPIAKNDRAYGVSRYGIELRHTVAGWVREVTGGEATAEVVSEKIGAEVFQKKHLGPLKYEEVSFKAGAGMSKEFYEWMKTGFNHTSTKRGREDGAIIQADYDYNEVTRLTWTEGMVTEFGMPALDAASKDAALMSIKFRPETTRRTWGAGGKVTFASDSKKAKQWLPSNFKLRIDGLDNGCMKVNKIEALTIKQKVTENAIGEHRDYQIEGTSVEVPNLVITTSESHADDFYKWHEDFVIKGKNGEEYEKTASLEYLTSDLLTVLFTLNFKHLGIFKISPDKAEAGAEPVRRVKIEMYCEEIDYTFSSAAVFGGR